MIPENIGRAAILTALHEIVKQGVPRPHRSRKFLLLFQGVGYPPKYVISLANRHANGHELPTSNFSGGVETNAFLRERGFEIVQIQVGEAANPRPSVSQTEPKPVRTNRHTGQRCRACKDRIGEFLAKAFGEVARNHQFDAGVLPGDFKGHPSHDSLSRIYSALQRFRGHEAFVRTTSLPRVDFFVPRPGFIVEVDESQHFTDCRRLTLERYPHRLRTGFDLNQWIDLCRRFQAKDFDPPYRDEQRAWYDTLRDFLPESIGLLPTVRLYSGARRWCEMDPERESHVSMFKGLIDIRPGERSQLTIFQNPKPRLGRIIISGEWDGSIASARRVLRQVCRRWPEGVTVDCLITCGAFLVFDWPSNLKVVGDPRFPDPGLVARLTEIAEDRCHQLLDETLCGELAKLTRYLTLGVDSHKSRISVSTAQIRQPHAELVALFDVKARRYHWTGKSYPTSGQESGLIRIEDLDSHFVDTDFGKVMLLGCHDLNVFSRRGNAVTKAAWRIHTRAAFYEKANQEKPDVVLHHPHTTDSSRIWTSAWNELTRKVKSVKAYIAAGRYWNDAKPPRSRLQDVLSATKFGPAIDVLVGPEC